MSEIVGFAMGFMALVCIACLIATALAFTISCVVSAWRTFWREWRK